MKPESYFKLFFLWLLIVFAIVGSSILNARERNNIPPVKMKVASCTNSLYIPQYPYDSNASCIWKPSTADYYGVFNAADSMYYYLTGKMLLTGCNKPLPDPQYPWDYYCNNTVTSPDLYAIFYVMKKIDSVIKAGGGGGGGTVTNVATGYGLQGGPITTTGTISNDTTRAIKQGIPTIWFTDSIVNAYFNRAGTVTSVATGFGILGGTITTTGTLKIDTTRNIKAGIPTVWFVDSTVSANKTGGTVTSIATGYGLQGGTITSSGTIRGDTTRNIKVGMPTIWFVDSIIKAYFSYSSLASGQITYANGTSSITSNANLTFEDGTRDQLDIGTGTFQSGWMNLFANTNNYYQLLLQNKNNGNKASTDLVFNNDQDSTHYLNVGFNSSGNVDATYTAIWKSGAYMYNTAGGIWIGTTLNDTVGFFINGATKAMRVAYFTSSYFNVIGSITMTSADNTAVGRLSTANGNFSSAYGYEANSGTFTNATSIGYQATAPANNTVMIGNGSISTVSIGAGSNVVPVQTSTSSTGTISGNGSQILELTATVGAYSVTIAPQTSPAPLTGQLLTVSSKNATYNVTWTGTFSAAPTSITTTTPARFFWDGSAWVNR